MYQALARRVEALNKELLAAHQQHFPSACAAAPADLLPALTDICGYIAVPPAVSHLSALDAVLQTLPGLTTLAALVSTLFAPSSASQAPLRCLAPLLDIILFFASDEGTPIGDEAQAVKQQRANEWVVRCLCALLKPLDQFCAAMHRPSLDGVAGSECALPQVTATATLEGLYYATVAGAVRKHVQEAATARPATRAWLMQRVCSRSLYPEGLDAAQLGCLQEATVLRTCAELRQGMCGDHDTRLLGLLRYTGLGAAGSLSSLGRRATCALLLEFPSLHLAKLQHTLQAVAARICAPLRVVERAVWLVYGLAGDLEANHTLPAILLVVAVNTVRALLQDGEGKGEGGVWVESGPHCVHLCWAATALRHLQRTHDAAQRESHWSLGQHPLLLSSLVPVNAH